MTSCVPSCRHRGRELADNRWICRSPKLVVPGRLVSGDFCRGACWYVDEPTAVDYPGAETLAVPLPPQAFGSVTLRPELVAVGVVAAPRPVPTLKHTLHELRRAGFCGPIDVFCEPGTPVPLTLGVSATCNPARLGIWKNWRSAAEQMLRRTTAPFVLLCEDDLWLAPDAALGLQRAIDTLPRDSWGFASLYTPLHNLAGAVPVVGWQPLDPRRANWGALGYCFTRQSLARLLQSSAVQHHRSDRDSDLVVTAAMREAGLACYYHVPSLAAHAGGMNSSVGHQWVHEHLAYGFDHERRHYTPPAPPPRQDKRLRVGLVTVGLGLGGVETWLLQLASGLKGPRIQVSGVAFVGEYQNFAAMAEAMLGVTRLFVRRSGLADAAHRGHPSLVETESHWHSLKRLAEECDVLIVWGVAGLNDLMTTLDFPGRVIMVSQGECDWTGYFLSASCGRNHERVAVSQAAARRFPGGAAAKVIYNAADETRCRATVPRETVRSAWGVWPEEKVIGFFGRFSAEKQPLRAARAARALGPGHRAVFVGTGQLERELRQQLPSLSPTAVVTGPRRDAGNVLSAFDVFMLASEYEGMSLAMVEAWLCGVPVVSTAVGAVPELEQRFGQLVFRVPSNPSDHDLAAAVRAALAPSAGKVVARAQAVARKHLTAVAMCRQWKKFLLGGK